MNIGKLDRLVVIKQATFTQDGFGENIASNSTLATVWARFEFEKGKAGYEADTFIGTAPAKMTIRYRSDIQISPKHYIEYNSKDWFIRSVEEIGRKEGLILRVEEKTTD
jgi:head-tail adaptor